MFDKEITKKAFALILLHDRTLDNFSHLDDLLSDDIFVHCYEIEKEFQVTELNSLFNKTALELSLIIDFNKNFKYIELLIEHINKTIISGKITIDEQDCHACDGLGYFIDEYDDDEYDNCCSTCESSGSIDVKFFQLSNESIKSLESLIEFYMTNESNILNEFLNYALQNKELSKKLMTIDIIKKYFTIQSF